MVVSAFAGKGGPHRGFNTRDQLWGAVPVSNPFA